MFALKKIYIYYIIYYKFIIYILSKKYIYIEFYILFILKLKIL